MKLEDRIKEKLRINKKNNIITFPKKNLLIEITNHCNNKCIFCYNDCMRRSKRFIEKELCEKILVDAYNLGMREVGFYVAGEPLLDKRLEDFILYAKSIGYKYIYLTTNGILGNLERIKKLYNSGLDSIKYSINATNREDYKIIHGTDNFDRVTKNLADVYSWKNNSDIKLKVYVSYISTNLTNDNKRIAELFENKCDEFIVMPAINQGGLIPNISCISSAEKSDINGNFKLPCSYPFNSVIVTVEGYLTACCMDFENLLAYANLNEVSLEEAWNNTIISEFRNRHLSKDVKNTICQNCIFNTNDIPLPLDNNLCQLKIFDKSIFRKCLEKRKVNKDGSNKCIFKRRTRK